MKTVSSAQMREMDRRTTAEYGASGEALMERAGSGVARIVDRLATVSGAGDSTVLLLAGRGNNGGDAFVAAGSLHRRGFDVDVWMTGEKKSVHGDARTHLNRLLADGVAVEELTEAGDCDDLLDSAWDSGLVVDGILGTGISGPVRGIAAEAIRCVNVLGEDRPVVAIDVPSGLNADTGQAEGEAVRADITATMAFPKTGLIAPEAIEYVGAVEIVDIGIPAALAAGIRSGAELIVPDDLREMLPRRKRDSHKGLFGHVLLIGGAPGYAGAVALAARAALRSGAGRVTVLTPASISAIVAGLAPEAMVHGGACNDTGSLTSDSLLQWTRTLDRFDGILAGPGMTPHTDTRGLVEILLTKAASPLVLDADALNAFAGQCDALRKGAGRLTLTPHPAEAGRLLGIPTAAVQTRRLDTARTLTERTAATVILKGAGTVVAAPDRTPGINLTGNPGMACGGMGDVLGGLLAGLLAQGLAPFDAARLAVYLHGSAGDDAAWRGSQAGLAAGDVVDALPRAFQRISLR